jgi:transposase-like protein
MKTDLAKLLFAQAFATGASYTDIARTLNISRRTAFYWRQELGLPGRPLPWQDLCLDHRRAQAARKAVALGR